METQPRHWWLAAIYAATIFISAFLLFQIQPMISKAILPWFGGTPAVWTTCLLFFQTLLFAGYAYAHFSNTWLSRKWQALVHILVIAAALALALALRSVLPGASQKPSGEADPTTAILAILAIAVGLPYFVLSATGPLLQAWFADAFPNRTAYRLYALSNAGSLLALVSYPFLFEAAFDLPRQDGLWLAGFVVFGLLCAYTAFRVWAAAPAAVRVGQGVAAGDAARARSSAAADGGGRPPLLHFALWLILPALGTATLMATTNHVSTDVAIVPLLWVVPLALYLLTFIIAFDRPAWYRPLLVAAVTLLAIYVTAFSSKYRLGYTKIYQAGITGPTLHAVAELLDIPTKDADGRLAGPRVYISFMTALAANFLAMFGLCFLFHGELARLKPPTRYLTAYYLMLAGGGALGGLAVAVVAPHVFQTIFEWKLIVFVGTITAIGLILNALVGRAVAPLDQNDGRKSSSSVLSWVALIILLVPTSFVLLDMVEFLKGGQQGVVFEHRNFFGTLTIREEDKETPAQAVWLLRHGTTLHGAQYMAAERRGEPLSYYPRHSGVGRVFEFFAANRPPGGLRVGDVGLGTGTLAAYVGKGDFLTFYEINPAVVEMATSGKWFTYYPDALARGAKVDHKLGDARLTLEQEVRTPKLPRYHVLVLDAFSGDAVPTHLLTIEAFDAYLPRLATEEVDGADGALIVHVSNRYLDLSRVVRAAAEKIDLQFVEIHNRSDSERRINGADWIILTRNEALLAALEPHAYKPDEPLRPPVLWTDARSSLFEILE
jgi:hypothetical protein